MQMHPQEQQLVSGARRGDRASFEQLYQLYYAPVYALAYGATRERNAAAGILRDTFSTAWMSLHALPDAEPFGRWVQRICYVQCDAHLRRTGRTPESEERASRQPLPEADPESFRLPHAYTTEPELQVRLERAVSALSDRQQRALILYYNNGLTVEDAAVVMGVRPGTVLVWLAESRREIVRRLREEERAAGRELPWADASETVPFRMAEQAQVLGGMIAGTAVGLVLEQTLASAAAGGAAAGGAAAGAATSTLSGTAAATSVISGTATGTAAAASGAAAATTAGTAAGMGLATKIVIGVTAAAIVAGGGYGVKQVIDNRNSDTDSRAAAQNVQMLSEVRCYNADGTLRLDERYDYDENTLLIRSTTSEYESDGTAVYEDMTHTYEYDDAGRAVTVRIGDSPVIEFEYDDAGHLVREYQGDSSDNAKTYTYEYDADGHRVSMHKSYSGTNESSWSVSETQNDQGGVRYDMTLETGPDYEYPSLTESYDAQGRMIYDAAEGEIRYYYHDEKQITLVECAAGDGVEAGSPNAEMVLLMLDSEGTDYHSVFLGVGGDAKKTYDDNGFLTRLDFSDGSYAELTYRSTDGAPVETAEPAESPEPSDTPEPTAAADPYYGYGALIEEIAGYLRDRTGEPNSPLVHLLGDAMMNTERTPGYAFMDLDGDGVMELLIGTSEPDTDPDYGKNKRSEGNIYALYTLRGGQPYSVHVSGVRFMLSLCSDGSLRELSSGSAFTTYFRYYHFVTDQLIPFELVFTDDWYTQENGLPDLPFYNTNGRGDDYSQQITQEQADEITLTKHVPTMIDYQPFPV